MTPPPSSSRMTRAAGGTGGGRARGVCDIGACPGVWTGHGAHVSSFTFLHAGNSLRASVPAVDLLLKEASLRAALSRKSESASVQL